MVRFTRSQTAYLACLLAPLFIGGCHDETDSVLGIVLAVIELVVNIVELAS